MNIFDRETDAFSARNRIQWKTSKDVFLRKSVGRQDLKSPPTPKSKKYMIAMSLLTLSLLILPCYVFLQTRLHVLDVSLENQRNIYEDAYEENRLLKDDMRNFSSEILHNFSKLGLKKIFAKDIPIVEFQDTSTAP